MSKAQVFRDQSSEDLEASYADKRKELFNLVNEKRMNKQFEKPHRIKLIKKDIARMLTVITEKQKA